MLNMFMLTVCQENRSIWRRNVCFPCGGIAGGGRRKVWRQGWLMRMFSKWLSMSFVSPCLAYQSRNLHYVELLVSRPPSTSLYRWHWVSKECAIGDSWKLSSVHSGCQLISFSTGGWGAYMYMYREGVDMQHLKVKRYFGEWVNSDTAAWQNAWIHWD